MGDTGAAPSHGRCCHRGQPTGGEHHRTYTNCDAGQSGRRAVLPGPREGLCQLHFTIEEAWGIHPGNKFQAFSAHPWKRLSWGHTGRAVPCSGDGGQCWTDWEQILLGPGSPTWLL